VGRHRAPVTTGRKVLYRLVVPLGAVAAVVVLIVVLIGLNGHSSGNGPGPGVITASTPRIVIPSTTPTHSPSPSATPSATLKPSHKPAPPARHHHPVDRNAMASVRVFNTTAIQGLAHHVAAEVQARGWQVSAVGNISLAESSSTLYYSPSAHAAAHHLAREFSGIRRLAPNSAVGITTSGLTLALAADWHD
jgi:hypothetical protein